MIAQESLPTLGRWSVAPRRTIYLPTVDSATSIPSINNSPWIRGAPHSGSPGSSAGSVLESRNQSLDGRRRGGTSTAGRRGNRFGANEYGLRLDDDDRV